MRAVRRRGPRSVVIEAVALALGATLLATGPAAHSAETTSPASAPTRAIAAGQVPAAEPAPRRSLVERASVKGNVFDCTRQKDRRKKLTAAEVFVHPGAVPIDLSFANFRAEPDFDEASSYLRYVVSVDVTWGLKVEVKLGVHCELSAEMQKKLSILDKPIQMGPVPGRVRVGAMFEFETTGKGTFTATQTRKLVLTAERKEGQAPTLQVGFDAATPIRVSLAGGLDASVTAGMEVELFGGAGAGGKKVGLGVTISAGAKFAAESQGGCAELFFAVPIAVDLHLNLWKAEWTLVQLSHDFARTSLKKWCATRPTIKRVLPAATLGVSYDQRLETTDNRSGRWALASGSLPPGLVFDEGRLFGVPSGEPGTRTLYPSFTDVSNQTTTTPVSLEVKDTPPVVAGLRGNIARLADGTSWYVDLRGGRHAIADGGTYECLVAQGASVIAVSPADVSSLPVTERAACVRAEIGDIIRTNDRDAYVLGEGWVRRWIPDGDSYDCLVANGHEVVFNVPRYYVMDRVAGPDQSFQCVDRAAAPGRVVRADDGSSWYVDQRSTPHWIPNGGTYECITQQGRPVYPHVIPRRMLRSIGEPKEHASCVRAGIGDIIRTSDGDSYLVNAGWTRSWIPDGRTYQCLRANDHAVVDNVPRYYVMDLPQVADAALNCYDANAVRGKAVRADDGSSFYIDKRGGKHWIPDGGSFECIAAQTGGAWPYRVPVSWLTQQKYEDARCVRAGPGDIIRHDNGDAYLLNGDWTRSWIPDAPTYACLRAQNRNLVNSVPRYYVDDLTKAGNASFPTGHCIVRRPNGNAYYVNNEGKKEWIPDTPTWDCQTGRGIPVLNTSDSVVDSVPEVGWHYCLNKANLRGKMLRHVDGDVSVIHGDDSRTWVPDEFTYGCRSRAGVPVVETRWREYVNSFRDAGWDYCFDINTFKNRYIRHPDGDIYFVDGRGVRHWVPNAGVQNCLNGRFGAPATVRWRDYVNRLPSGDWAVCGDTLWRNQNFDIGQTLVSGNGVYRLEMQTDANLVLYRGSRAIWASSTNGRNVHHLKLHNSGCLALIDPAGNWLWRPSPDPCNKGGDRLVVQGDGNLVLYAGSRAVWASNTVGR